MRLMRIKGLLGRSLAATLTLFLLLEAVSHKAEAVVVGDAYSATDLLRMLAVELLKMEKEKQKFQMAEQFNQLIRQRDLEKEILPDFNTKPFLEKISDPDLRQYYEHLSDEYSFAKRGTDSLFTSDLKRRATVKTRAAIVDELESLIVNELVLAEEDIFRTKVTIEAISKSLSQTKMTRRELFLWIALKHSQNAVVSETVKEFARSQLAPGESLEDFMNSSFFEEYFGHLKARQPTADVLLSEAMQETNKITAQTTELIKQATKIGVAAEAVEREVNQVVGGTRRQLLNTGVKQTIQKAQEANKMELIVVPKTADEVRKMVGHLEKLEESAKAGEAARSVEKGIEGMKAVETAEKIGLGRAVWEGFTRIFRRAPKF